MRNRSSDIIDNLTSRLEAKIDIMINNKINQGQVSAESKVSFTRNDIFEFGATQMLNIREHSTYAIWGNGGGGSVGP